MFASPNRFWFIVLWDDDNHIAPLAEAFRYRRDAQQFAACRPGSRIHLKERVYWPVSPPNGSANFSKEIRTRGRPRSLSLMKNSLKSWLERKPQNADRSRPISKKAAAKAASDVLVQSL